MFFRFVGADRPIINPNFKKISYFYIKKGHFFKKKCDKNLRNKIGRKEEILTKKMIYRLFIVLKPNHKCILCFSRPKSDKTQL